MGEEDDTRINSLFNILNDLAKGQKAMMDLMGQLAKNSLEGNKSRIRMVMGVQTMERVATHALPCRATPTCTPNPPDPLCLNFWGMRPQVH
jgi:hypothetical protein